MHRIVLYFILLGTLSLSACNQEKASKGNQLDVVASIKPVQSIVLAIGGDKINSQQLIPDYVSPHHYAFKPSDNRKIKNADVIFRVDENFESLLNPAFENLIDKSRIITLAENPAIKMLPILGRHFHESGSHDHESESSDRNIKNHQKTDLHIFTSPSNAMEMATQIANTLSKLDPNNKNYYDENLKSFGSQIQKVSDSIRENLVSVKDQPYVVFHHSWQYFGEYFDLQPAIIVDFQEGFSSGSKTLSTIRKRILDKNIKCVFSDPSIRNSRIETLIEDFDVKTAKIDVLQSNLELNQNTYINWLQEMGENVTSCLK